MSDGSTIEVASVGSEGIVGVPALGRPLDGCTYLQVADGTVQYMSLPAFELLCSVSEFGSAVRQYCSAFLAVMMQLASCNQSHSLESRCARWVMLLHERTARANFELTQPFLAMALGTTPAELGVVMDRLVESNVVRFDATSVTVLDPIALRRRACRCYPQLQTYAAAGVVRRSRRARLRAKVVPIQLPQGTVCAICGLSRDHPHKTHGDCLRALDAEARSLLYQAKKLQSRRAAISIDFMLKFEQFKRRQS